MKKKIRLLFTDDSLPAGGGKEILLLNHLKGLDRRLFEVHLIILSDSGELIERARELADYSAVLERKFRFDPHVIWKLRKYLIHHNIQIVHTNIWFDSLYVLLASRGLSIKRIASVHGYNFTWRDQVNRWVLKKFDNIICVSRALKLDLFKQGIPWEKLSVIHNCFDKSKFHLNTATNKHKRISFQLCMVGRFEWTKDHATLCEAVGLLKEKRLPIELTIVGRGDKKLENECKNICKRFDIEKKVHFLGLRNDIPEILAQMDCFVFSSLCDTFGIALLEAMACGLPVVVSDIPSLMELIQHGKCGLYFETGNAYSCAKEIEKLSKDSNLRKSLGRKAFQRAQDFHENKIVKKLENHYLKIMNISN